MSYDVVILPLKISSDDEWRSYDEPKELIRQSFQLPIQSSSQEQEATHIAEKFFF